MPKIVHPLRFLVSTQDTDRINKVEKILAEACADYPETFENVKNVENVIDHVGYHDSTLSSVVWSKDYAMAFMRLTIRPNHHIVFSRLLEAMTAT